MSITRVWICTVLGSGAMALGAAGCGSCDADTPSGGPRGAEDPRAGDRVELGDPALPGTQHVDRALVARLHAALVARGSDYRPRAEHMEEDGVPTYTNRLILETSPYLLQHAHNPVNWFPWGEEAFARARAEGKPIFLSIGYSTCHWCHVMERESFEDEEVARYINEHFIPIKVDRERRPDIDDIYMRAVQAMSGHGGWPMTVVMTPDKQPFFGGTYFPPRSEGGRRGLLDILHELASRYDRSHEEVVAQASALSRRIAGANASARPGDVPGPEVLVGSARLLASTFDPRWGGFGRAPKFPQPARLSFLLRYARRTGDPGATRIVTTTLRKMADGGMYDQVGGGFHRYSTDGRWLVPHFEKMLYDNAQLAAVYVEAWQSTGEDRFAQVARETLDYISREMSAPGGGFYSATDADSPGPGGRSSEGWFFTWTPAEVEAAVGADSARVVRAAWGLTAEGNFGGRNILYRPRSYAGAAAELGMDAAHFDRALSSARAGLYEARSRRSPPFRDDKIVTAWNALMISALARAAFALGQDSYRVLAERSMRRILTDLRGADGRLMRIFAEGRATHPAYLEDYAAVIQALLDLYGCTWDEQWIRDARDLSARLDAHFWDAEGGGYFMTSDDAEELPVRDKPSFDGALPSGNSLMLLNSIRLAELTAEQSYRERAERSFATFSANLAQGRAGMPMGLVALDYYLDRALEIVIVVPAGGDPAPLVDRVRRTYVPNAFLSVVDAEHAARAAGRIPALEGKVPLGGRPTAYVCEHGRCELPTGDPRVLGRQLSQSRPLFADHDVPPLVIRGG